MECADVAAFIFAVTNKTVFTLHVYFAEAMVINLFATLRVFLVGFGK